MTEHEKELNRAKQRRYLARHRVEMELARPAVFRSPHAVVALTDSDGKTRWTEAVGTGREAYWAAVWQYREQIDSPLGNWFKTLDGPPVETVVLGRVDAKAAKMLAAFLADEAGESILRERTRPGVDRATWHVKPDGTAERFPTVAAACRAVGLRDDCGLQALAWAVPGGGRLL